MTTRLKNIAPKIAKTSKVAKHVNARILTIDIETRPNMGYVWSLWKQNIGLSQLVETGHVMCWVAKWYDEKEPIFMSDFHDGHDAMIQGAWDLLSEADAVISYNGLSFDMPHLNREFALLGLTPPAPYKNIDLIRTVRKEFNFPSNKLAHVVDALGVGGKMETGGFDLWVGCMNDDPKAWAKMKKYNLTDVKITEKLYDRIRPWIKGHPHLGMFIDADGNGESFACPNCGNKKLTAHPERTVRANVQQYEAFTCGKCGTQIRGTKKLRNPNQTRAAI